MRITFVLPGTGFNGGIRVLQSVPNDCTGVDIR